MKNHILARAKNKLFTKRLQKKYGLFNQSFDDSVSVIMFHKIINGENIDNDKFYSKLEEFEKYVDYLNKKVGFINPYQLFVAKSGTLLTFDDATNDLYKVVFPILKKHKIPFLVFVPIGKIGTDGYISKEQLLEMSKCELCYFGAHSVNHIKLRFSNNSKEEIYNSITELGKLLSKNVEYFAYPYGTVFACSKKNIKTVSKSGVICAFSTVPGYINNYAIKHKYFLPRFNGDKLVYKFIKGEEETK